jgi:hypothetical protein
MPRRPKIGEERMPRPLPVAIFSLAAIVGLVFVGRGSFVHTVVVLALLLYIAGPLLLVSAVLFAFRRGRPKIQQALRGVIGIVIILLTTLLSLPAGGLVHDRDVARAKAFCEALVPELDRYKQTTGSYPRTIAPVLRDAPPPLLLRDRTFYMSNGAEFEFSFTDRAGMMNGFTYFSAERIWQLED